MRSIRLPETDIANLAFKSFDFKVSFLSRWLQPKQIKGSYEPLRRSVGEAANLGLPLFPDIPATSLQQLESLVLKNCKGNAELAAMNLAPVRAIRCFVESNGIEAEFLEELPIALYPGMRYAFWTPMLVRYEGQARIVFFDLRRTGGLDQGGHWVCFSVMHERFRALNPDYADVQFESWRFSNNSERTIRAVREWRRPIRYDEIVSDVAETYAILNMLRTRDVGGATGTDDGPLPLFR